MKYNDNGEYKDIYIKTFDTLPVGTEVDYTGTTVPDGWTQVDSYSTSEVDTGKTWIDGKKIYRKVISDTLGTTNGTWKDISLFSTNYVDKILSIVGTFNYTNGAFNSIPFFRGTDANYSNREYVLCNYNINTGNFGIVAYHPTNYSLMSGQPFQVVIEYTKIND